MNTYVIMSWSHRREVKCIGVNVSRGSAENAAMHAVEDYIRFSGCGGEVASNDAHDEFWPEKNENAFRVKIDTVKTFINFSSR